MFNFKLLIFNERVQCAIPTLIIKHSSFKIATEGGYRD